MAGLPVNYVVRQMEDYKSGDRTSLYRRHNSMLLSAAHATEEEVRAAAEYYVDIEPIRHFGRADARGGCQPHV